MQTQEWCTIESDPAVFTELIKSIGVQDVQVEEIYDLNDDQMIDNLQPIYGLIFLFRYYYYLIQVLRWTSQGEKRECLQEYDQELFFANQVIQNACATQAIISVLLNVPDLKMGQDLQNYKEFAMALDPRDRGLVLGNSDVIRTAHNSFARPEPFIFTGKKKAKEGDAVYHFIAYVPFSGLVYELDGLQQGPILLGHAGENNSNWVAVAREAVLKRISIYQQSEITFTLLAINKCKKAIANEKIQQNQIEQQILLVKLQGLGISLDIQQQVLLETLKDKNNQQVKEDQMQEELSAQDIQIKLHQLEQQIEDYKQVIEQQAIKLENYKVENIRRKHNYIPLILEMLKICAQKGKLEDLIEEAKNKQTNKQNKQQKTTQESK